jgi:hypothetical protein
MKAKKQTATARPRAVPPPAPEPSSFPILGHTDDGEELNPGIIEELEPNQGEALRLAAYRLGESGAEAVRRLIGFALFVTGIDPASQDEAIDVLEKLFGDAEEATGVINQFLGAETEARALCHKRDRFDRVEYLKERQAEIKRLPSGLEAYVAQRAATATA